MDDHLFPLSMNSKKILSCGALALGILSFLAGVVFIAMYISEAILTRLGDPDQSLIFWYLPILFIGIAGIILGLGAGILGFIGLRKNHPSDGRIEAGDD